MMYVTLQKKIKRSSSYDLEIPAFNICIWITFEINQEDNSSLKSIINFHLVTKFTKYDQH